MRYVRTTPDWAIVIFDVKLHCRSMLPPILSARRHREENEAITPTNGVFSLYPAVWFLGIRRSIFVKPDRLAVPVDDLTAMR